LGSKENEGIRGRLQITNIACEELHNLYASPYIIRVIKSRWMSWERHVTRMGEMRNTYNILVGQPEGRDHSQYLGVDRKVRH
jgi:hypothetical protein